MKQALLFLTLSVIASSADTPPDNNLPTIGIRINKNETPELSDVTLEHLAMLSWRYFDGVDAWAWPTDSTTWNAADYCDSLGMVLALLPVEMTGFLEPADTVYGLWFRLADEPLSSSHAFARPDTSDWEDLEKYLGASAMYDTLESRMDDLHAATDDYPAYWFFGLWDEGNTNQRSHMVMADTSAQYGEYYGYWPDMFTQDRSEGDHTPTMESIDPEGTFSWLKHAFDQTASTIPVSTTLGTLLTYEADCYPGLPGDSDLVYGTLADMGRCVRGIRDMLFTPPSGSQSTANAPEFICFDRYPFRHVEAGIDTEMGDTCWIYLIDQAEESMDSVVLNAGDMPVYFYTQLFGGFGGPAMRDGEGDLDYESLDYRQPSIAEFRMLCSLAQMHQMKGIFPYDIRSYHEAPGDTSGDWVACSLLDWDLIPFDAPYEEWVYSGRLAEDVCSPESIPPFDGYDPLFELDEAPVISGERGRQNYSEWRFAPFANIWNGIGDVLGEVKAVGPEMRDLWWLDGTGHPGLVQFSWADTCWGGPECRVFARDSTFYLYYVNRCCADSAHVIGLYFSYDSLDVPSIYALDHSRRLIVQSDLSRESFFSLTDTLEAGQGRLLEFMPQSTSADLRMTAPDVWAEGPAGVTRDFRFSAGDEIEMTAVVYNLGTTARDSVPVTVYDISEDSTLIDSMLAELAGLSKTSRLPSTDTLSFAWATDSTDIGAHVLEVNAHEWPGEPDGDDNIVRVAFLIDPRDYATAIVDDPWDMMEATSGVPAWKTNDVDSLRRWDTGTYTDSIGGMFEGEIAPGDFSTNRMYLHIPASSLFWIDGGLYNQLSLMAKCSVASELIVGCVDSHNTESSSLVDTIGTTWGDTGPIDLSALLSGETVKKLWLRFDPIGSSIVNVRVRIGQVRLEEEAP